MTGAGQSSDDLFAPADVPKSGESASRRTVRIGLMVLAVAVVIAAVAAVILGLVLLAVFVLPHLLPGDPA
ncbi:MAG: hypothetical protein JWP19_1738 [Rhodoglobus sp.]|nr:hypothetical protein [Rhodoglobus sp.]